jgi:hypothetical protein
LLHILALALAFGRIVRRLGHWLGLTTGGVVDVVFQTRWRAYGDYAGSELDANGDIVM